MPKLITICLTPEQQKQLEQIRDTDKNPYMRERATLVPPSNGRTDAIYDWVHRYEKEGIKGLLVKPGRKPAPQNIRKRRKLKKLSCTLFDVTLACLIETKVVGV